MSDYLLTLGCLIVVGVILAVSLNLVQGYAGIVTVSHGAFMGIGAYTCGILSTRLGIDTAIGLLLGALLAGGVGWLFMILASRLDPDDFILASFALQMVVVDLFLQWTPVTNGAYGLFGIERPVVGPVSSEQLPVFAVLVLVLGACTWIVCRHIANSNYGLLLRGIRESPRSIEAAGKDATRIQVVTFALASVFAGLAGGIYATAIGLITPADFDIHRSILVIAFLLVGGMGNMTGAVLGTVALLALPEAVKALSQLPSQWEGPGEQIVYGIVIVLFVWFRPQGIFRERPVLLVRRGGRGISLGGRIARSTEA